MQKQKTIYHLIVDKSSSMGDCIEQTISGFNEQVSKIQQLQNEFPEQDLSIGLTTFNHEVFHHFFQSPPSTVRALNTSTYVPAGSTALLDAVGTAINNIERTIEYYPKELNTTVVVVILTDGHENASQMFKLADIKNMISRLEETGKWTFSFIGATLDAAEVAASMAIKRENSMMFSKNDMKSGLFDRLSNSMENYMEKKRKGDSLDNFL